jgi:hypothetical protein
MSLEIKFVKSRSDMINFLNLPKFIYGHQKFCPPTTPLQIPNSTHYQFFLALENNQPVGRVAAIINSRYIEPDTGFFGALEAIQQPAVGRELLRNAEEWLAAQKIKRIVGPATMNTNQQVGVLIKGFEEPPTPFIPYNPPYYQDLVEGFGFHKLTDLLSYSYSLKQKIPPFLKKIARRAKQKTGLTLRSLNTFYLRPNVQAIQYILNEAMINNWGYIPLTSREISSLVYYCLSKGDPSLASIITMGKKPAAFSLCLPVTRSGLRARMAFLAVVPAFRMLGLESLLITRTIEIVQSRGHSTLEISQVDEKNEAMQKIITKFSCPLIKCHRVYQKNIDG